MKKYVIMAALVIAAILVAGCYSPPSPPPSSFTIGLRAKTSGCSLSLNSPNPDVFCTPGAINLSATKDDICTPGYTSKVRSVSDKTKEEVYASYGITSYETGEYEIDHFIPLALGGSNDISNLWPQPAIPLPGYHEKDRVERYLHDQVCDGKISLTDAQRGMVYTWPNIYKSIVAAP